MFSFPWVFDNISKLVNILQIWGSIFLVGLLMVSFERSEYSRLSSLQQSFQSIISILSFHSFQQFLHVRKWLLSGRSFFMLHLSIILSVQWYLPLKTCNIVSISWCPSEFSCSMIWRCKTNVVLLIIRRHNHQKSCSEVQKQLYNSPSSLLVALRYYH